jgi:hypothetical protein
MAAMSDLRVCISEVMVLSMSSTSARDGSDMVAAGLVADSDEEVGEGGVGGGLGVAVAGEEVEDRLDR